MKPSDYLNADQLAATRADTMKAMAERIADLERSRDAWQGIANRYFRHIEALEAAARVVFKYGVGVRSDDPNLGIVSLEGIRALRAALTPPADEKPVS